MLLVLVSETYKPMTMQEHQETLRDLERIKKSNHKREAINDIKFRTNSGEAD